MKRHVAVAVIALVAVVPLLGQTPKGWRLRVDRSTSASDPDAAKTDGSYGFRVNHLLEVQVDTFALSKQ